MTSSTLRAPRRRTLQRAASGYSLLTVLVAMLVFSLGMLGLGSMYARFTGAVTDNENLAQIAAWSDSFWSVLWANDTNLAASGVTYNLANYTSAPAAMQPWLAKLLNTLPDSSVQLAPLADPIGNPGLCSSPRGCTSLTMTIKWSQNASPIAMSGNGSFYRSQTFTYQLGF
jgi:type II secretory pathway pseudopilin PulG